MFLFYSISSARSVTTTTVHPVSDSDSDFAEYNASFEQDSGELSPFYVAEPIDKFEGKPIAFELVAQYIVDTAHKVQAICHTFCHQEDEISNAQLAESILYGTCSYTEQQKFKRILASDEERASFFDNPIVQISIAQAVSDGKFGTDPDVLQAIANNLGIFTDPVAQRNIACAIRGEKFGTDLNVLQAISNNLGIFTDPDAQGNVAWAIQDGKLGTDPNVLQTITNNLAIFIFPLAQIHIACAIRDGRFGTDSNVLQAIANNLGIFTDPQAQENIACAIQDGKFGTDPNVLQAIANNLGIFTDPEAQRGIVWVIRDKKFGIAPNVLQAIANNLGIFTDSVAQRDIAWAIRDQEFDIAPNLLQAIANNPQVQRVIALVIKSGELGTAPNVLQAIANNLAIFTDPVAQRMITSTIWLGKFGIDSNALQAITSTWGIFTNPDTQIEIACAIRDGEFATTPNVLQTIANNLDILTDPEAQKMIACAIKLGTHPNVLQAIANNLGIFTDPAAQRIIAWAILEGDFGTDPNTLQTIANNLGIFNDPEAQRDIACAIRNGAFGTDPNVLQALANNLGIFTDSDAQEHIAWAIRNGRFGTDPNLLQAIANNPQLQRVIASAIKLGTDPNVLQALANNLGIFTDPQAQRDIAWAIRDGAFGTDPNMLRTVFNTIVGIVAYQEAAISLMPNLALTLEEKMSILSQMKFSLSLPSEVGTIPVENLPELFGAKAYSNNEVFRLLKTRFSEIFGRIPVETLRIIQNDVLQEHVYYALQLRGTQLVLYPLTADQTDFMGWITSDETLLYKQCVTNVMVYDFGKLDTHGFPKIWEGKKLSPQDALFATLPGYLKQAVRDNHFDLTEFKHQKTIAFVNETLLQPLREANPDLVTQMQAIMQASIVTGGNYVKLTASDETNTEMKDRINELCHEVAKKVDFKEIVRQFLSQLRIDDQARLAVLLGTMAKKGVLGYEFNGINRANEVFYVLARECFNKLEGAVGIVFPANFHTRLAQGDCIEELTNDFIEDNAGRIDFHDVFALSVGV